MTECHLGSEGYPGFAIDVFLTCMPVYVDIFMTVANVLGCRRFKEKKETMEPEADPERDQRTVFAYQVFAS